MKRTTPAKSSVETAEDQSAQLDISSLIDVAFLLLIFFLVTSTLHPREADLDMSLAGEGGPPGSLVPITIAISADNSVLWGNELMLDSQTTSIEPLRAALRNHQIMSESFNQRPSFILHADDASSYQRMVDVLNAFAHEGVQELLLADKP